MELIINDMVIRTDLDGRYSLTDLWKSSGSINKKKPALFFKNDQTVEMIELLKVDNPTFECVVKTQGRYTGGSWVSKELVYKYAMWVSRPFELKVIRTFDAMSNGDYAKAHAILTGNKETLEIIKERDRIENDELMSDGEKIDKLTLLEVRYKELGRIAGSALGVRRGQNGEFKRVEDKLISNVQCAFVFN